MYLLHNFHETSKNNSCNSGSLAPLFTFVWSLFVLMTHVQRDTLIKYILSPLTSFICFNTTV